MDKQISSELLELGKILSTIGSFYEQSIITDSEKEQLTREVSREIKQLVAKITKSEVVS